METIKDILTKHSLGTGERRTARQTALNVGNGHNPATGGEGTQTPLDARSGDDSDIPGNFAGEITCPLCHDRGIVLTGNDATPCRCMQQRKLENRFRHARIARNLLQCRLEQFDLNYYRPDDPHDEQCLVQARKAWRAAQEFTQNYRENSFGLGLLLTGPVGSGKTFLAAAIANALVEQGKQVLFLVVPDLLDELRATFDKRSNVTEIDLLDSARSIPFLILDDLGAHNYTDWTKNRLYSIINYRLNEQLPTVVTTNLSLEEMEDYLGDRTTSRLVQMCRVFRLTVARDIRLRKYQEREALNSK